MAQIFLFFSFFLSLLFFFSFFFFLFDIQMSGKAFCLETTSKLATVLWAQEAKSRSNKH